MKQIPYLCNNEKEFIDRLDEFQESLQYLSGYSCILATIYADSELKLQIPELVQLLKQKIPQAKVIGGIVSANITAGVINLCGISLTFSVFFSSQVEIIPLHWGDELSSAMGKDVLYKIWQMQQPVAVQIISSGYNLNVTPFFQELSNIPDDIVVFGGVVDDGTVSGDGFVFTDKDYITRGMVVAVYRGENLFVNLCYSTGWQPLGRSMRITGLKDHNSTITELEGGYSIRDAYEKYLGVEWDDSFLDEAVVFPVCVERNGTILNRMPRRLGKDGSANYGADFHLGESVQICYGNPAEVIQGTYAIQYDMVRFQPEGIFAVSCWSRKVLLNRDVNQELEVCRVGVPSTGIYALGEYVRDDRGNIYLNNMMLSILGIREGGIQNVHRDMVHLKHRVKFQNKGNSVLSHMLHFVRAVSQELEAKSRSLQHIANTDKLTDIYNRRAIEEKLVYCIAKSEAASASLSLLLVDLDDFKHINDKFGHLVGDAALMHVAELIQANIPSDAYPGRWGGDEFLIILPAFSISRACTIGERIRDAVEKSAMEEGALHLSVSVGVTAFVQGDDKASFFKRADEALYKAKRMFNKNNVQSVECTLAKDM